VLTSGPIGLSLVLPLHDGPSLVMEFAAPSDAEFHLGAAFVEVEAERNQGERLGLGLAYEI